MDKSELLRFLKQQIIDKIVEPPDNMTLDQLNGWMVGYHAATKSCLEEIDDILEGR